MKLSKVTIGNFKAIKRTSLDLSDFTVIVGENGSGKSSILQALHWMFQSGRNKIVEAKPPNSSGSTLSEKDATYIPSPEYRNAGYDSEYGNTSKKPQLDVSVKAIDELDDVLEADMWIKSARNEGLSVHVPRNNEFVRELKKPREFSSYIPGLAGIPLFEEKKTRLIVERTAAAGDANTVLRNMLLILKNTELESESSAITNELDLVQDFVSEVFGKIRLYVDFKEDVHSTIVANFQTNEMIESGRPTKPLELSGAGFLQVIQIFAYLVHFKPVVLLVDEPDSHLHPAVQERLVHVLISAARKFRTQVILTTHSPSIVRALPPDASVIWMKNGEVQPDGNTTGRNMMRWGLLDKRILLLTEDTDLGPLQSILAQWPELERIVALWPVHGSANLPDAKGCASLQYLFDGMTKVVFHRDRDFMMPHDLEKFVKPYSDRGIDVWFTKYSDIESYWANEEVLMGYFSISNEDASDLLQAAVHRAQKRGKDKIKRNKMRKQIMDRHNDYGKGVTDVVSDDDVIEEYTEGGKKYQHAVFGKCLLKHIRMESESRNLNSEHKFGVDIPVNIAGNFATDLREVLNQQIR